jgi:predicted ATPase
LFEPHRIALICYPTDAKGQETFLTNEGTGASQLPFILLPIALTPPNETIFFCEPEAHLHPKLQSILVSRLLRIAEKEGRQFFVETHSEHILHGFLNAVAKKLISRDSLAIYYFEKVGGESKVTRLEVEQDGRIPGGLPGFFDHSISELADYLEALKNA